MLTKEVCSNWRVTSIEKVKKVHLSYVFFLNHINLTSSQAMMNAVFPPNWALINYLFEKKVSQNSVLPAKIQILVVLKVKGWSKCFFVGWLLIFERIYVIQETFHSFSLQSFFWGKSLSKARLASNKGIICACEEVTLT